MITSQQHRDINMPAIHYGSMMAIINACTIEDSTAIVTWYGVPDDKLLLLRYVDENGDVAFRNISSLSVHDGDRERLDLHDVIGDVVFDVFFDDDHDNTVRNHLKFVDNPFAEL